MLAEWQLQCELPAIAIRPTEPLLTTPRLLFDFSTNRSLVEPVSE
jgi:hypothetical protein